MASAQNPADANIARSPQNGLGRLAAWCYGHRPRVLLGWLLAVVAIIGLAQWAGSRLDNNFTLASSPSQQAQNLLASRFPSQKGLSRMREEWAQRRGDNSKAVANGLATTARVITAAAAIMVCVFGSFVIGDPLRILGVFGLGLAAAVLVDATVVRMVLVPAVMQLLGPANWWLPRWIGRATPNLAIEPNVDPMRAAWPAPRQSAPRSPSDPGRSVPQEASQPWSHSSGGSDA
jgi:uncharacterized membrane protein YdfJ with MMPL/SSD domain